MSHAQAAALDLASLLDDSLAPVYVIDEDRRIVFCNPACARWTGMTVGQLLGQRCVYHSETADGTPAAIAAMLCPPPQVFSGQPQTARIACPGRDGRVVERLGHFFPLSDGADESAAVVAVLGASDCTSDAPTSAAAAGAELHDQLRRLRRGRASRYSVSSLVGKSPALVRARAQVELAAQAGANVLIIGPTGAGKDHAAKAIHYRQSHAGALVPLECNVLETNLLRSTLRSAWSKTTVSGDAAVTLVLSGVDEMPAEAQSDLVELLGQQARHVRLIATATRLLAEAVAVGQFSPVLACALTTISIELPPLVERLEDLPLLAQAFLEQANVGNAKQVGGFSPGALDRLAAYAWPGNLDELTAVVREAHQRAQGGEVHARDLVDQIHWAAQAALHPPRTDEAIVLEEFLARVEKELIVRAMRRAKGNKSKAAKLLGLTRPRLYRRLVQLGLEVPGENESPA